MSKITANMDVLTDMVVEDVAQCKDLTHIKQKAIGVIIFHYPGGRGLSSGILGALADDIAESACLRLNIPC
jgi:hypothetical protein